MIVRKTCRELWPMFLIYLLSMEIILVPAIVLWPDLKEVGDKLGFALVITIKAMNKSVFRDVLQAVQDYGDYYALQAFFKGVNVCSAAAAVLVGTGLISRERENHTLEFLMTRPISPSRILFEKFTVASVGTVIPIFLVAWSGIPLSSWLVGESLPFGGVTLAAWHSSIFVLGILAVTTLCSVIFRLQAHTATVAGIFVVANTTLFFIQTAREYSLFQLSDIDVYAPAIAGERSASELFLSMQIWMIGSIVILYLITDRLIRRIQL